MKTRIKKRSPKQPNHEKQSIQLAPNCKPPFQRLRSSTRLPRDVRRQSLGYPAWWDLGTGLLHREAMRQNEADPIGGIKGEQSTRVLALLRQLPKVSFGLESLKTLKP